MIIYIIQKIYKYIVSSTHPNININIFINISFIVDCKGKIYKSIVCVCFDERMRIIDSK